MRKGSAGAEGVVSSFGLLRNLVCMSAIVELVRTLGSHPSDPGSSPGGGILFELRRSG